MIRNYAKCFNFVSQIRSVFLLILLCAFSDLPVDTTILHHATRGDSLPDTFVITGDIPVRCRIDDIYLTYVLKCVHRQ